MISIACVLDLPRGSSTEPLPRLHGPPNQVLHLSPELVQFSFDQQPDVGHEMLSDELEVGSPVLHLYLVRGSVDST